MRGGVSERVSRDARWAWDDARPALARAGSRPPEVRTSAATAWPGGVGGGPLVVRPHQGAELPRGMRFECPCQHWGPGMHIASLAWKEVPR
jgi:hypothetical protein